jgi:hypothetical protein
MHHTDIRGFLLRGKAKVSGEWQLVSLAYNLKRMTGSHPHEPAHAFCGVLVVYNFAKITLAQVPTKV